MVSPWLHSFHKCSITRAVSPSTCSCARIPRHRIPTSRLNPGNNPKRHRSWRRLPRMATSTDQQPLLDLLPPVITQPGVEKLDTPATITDLPPFPSPTFTKARMDARKRQLPQCISHRGYRAKFPENTLAAFKGAVEAGTQALETDVHLTKDEVVVLSHDASLKRCFGKPDKILEKTWEELKSERTVAEPHEPMPRLRDLLDYLSQPGLEEIWVLLDIKLDNDADNIMRLIASTLSATPPSPNQKDWKSRILLGIWAAKYLPLAQKYLPGYAVTHIGFSVSYARHFFTVPNVSFNMMLPVLIAPGGKRFLRDAMVREKRQVYAWTVNEEDKMEWCIRRKLDGVITDDPEKFLGVCEGFDEAGEREGWLPITVLGMLDVMRLWVWITVAFWLFRRRFNPVASRELIRREGGG